MAGKGSRTLLLSLVADTNQFNKGLKKSQSAFGKFGSAIKGAMAGAALAVAGFAAKWAGDGVKAAIEAEKVERRFAKTLKNVTKATDAQVAAVEEYISATQMATGVNDDELRKSLEILLRRTKDTTKAQKLQAIALDVAAGAGISLEQASKAITKAQDGNFASLRKLGVPLDETTIKTKNVNEAMKTLAQTFKGQADEAANTTAGKYKILQEQLGEIQEQVGEALLPVLGDFSDWLTEEGIDAIQTFFDVLTGKKVDKSKFTDLQTSAADLATAIKNAGTEIGKLFTALDLGNPNSAFNSLVRGLADIVGFLGSIFGWLDKIGIEMGAGNPLADLLAWAQGKKSPTQRTIENIVENATGRKLPKPAPKPGEPGFIGPVAPSTSSININVNGAVDPNATAKAVQNALNQAGRMGGYSWVGKGTG